MLFIVSYGEGNFISLGFSDIKEIETIAKRNVFGVAREELIPSLGNLSTRELL